MLNRPEIEEHCIQLVSCEHFSRVEQITGISRYNGRDYHKSFYDAYHMGFHLFVRATSMLKYPYAADAGRVNGIGPSVIEYHPLDAHKSIRYIGDMPDFALDNIESLRKTEWGRPGALTIHGVDPLPVVATSEAFLRVDPVLVMWPWPERVLFQYRRRGLIHRRWELETLTPDSVGIVVAVWRDDHERIV